MITLSLRDIKLILGCIVSILVIIRMIGGRRY